jgi:hypothetical protein
MSVRVVVGRNLFAVHLLLIGPISIPWEKDEHIWREGGMMIDREISK